MRTFSQHVPIHFEVDGFAILGYQVKLQPSFKMLNFGVRLKDDVLESRATIGFGKQPHKGWFTFAVRLDLDRVRTTPGPSLCCGLICGVIALYSNA
jgi:hypothetical protein